MDWKNIELILDRAQILYNKNNYKESESILLPLLKENIDKKQKFELFILIGANYKGLKEYKKSIDIFREVLKINHKYELASLSIYLSYICLEEYDLALEEIFRFLKDHKAVLYKDTLEELLTDIKDGHINGEIAIRTIQKLAKENNVKLE